MMGNEDWEAEKAAARAEMLREAGSIDPEVVRTMVQGVQSAAASMVSSIVSNPIMRRALAREAVAREWAEGARREKIRQEAEQAARDELARVAEFNQAKAEALERLGAAALASMPVAINVDPAREWGNLDKIEQEIVSALNAMGARNEKTGKKSGDVLRKIQLNGIDYYTQERIADRMTSSEMCGIVEYTPQKQARKYWLSDNSLIIPQ